MVVVRLIDVRVKKSSLVCPENGVVVVKDEKISARLWLRVRARAFLSAYVCVIVVAVAFAVYVLVNFERAYVSLEEKSPSEQLSLLFACDPVFPLESLVKTMWLRGAFAIVFAQVAIVLLMIESKPRVKWLLFYLVTCGLSILVAFGVWFRVEEANLVYIFCYIALTNFIYPILPELLYLLAPTSRCGCKRLKPLRVLLVFVKSALVVLLGYLVPCYVILAKLSTSMLSDVLLIGVLCPVLMYGLRRLQLFVAKFYHHHDQHQSGGGGSGIAGFVTTLSQLCLSTPAFYLLLDLERNDTFALALVSGFVTEMAFAMIIILAAPKQYLNKLSKTLQRSGLSSFSASSVQRNRDDVFLPVANKMAHEELGEFTSLAIATLLFVTRILLQNRDPTVLLRIFPLALLEMLVDELKWAFLQRRAGVVYEPVYLFVKTLWASLATFALVLCLVLMAALPTRCILMLP